MHPWIMNPWIPFHEWAGETPSDWCPIVLFTFKASRIHIKPFVAILSKEIQFALWFKATLSKIFVATIQVLWVVSSLEFILNLLPQSLQRKSWLLSDSKLLFKNLCGNSSSLVSSFKSRIHIEPLAAILTKEILFALWFKATLQISLWQQFKSCEWFQV